MFIFVSYKKHTNQLLRKRYRKPIKIGGNKKNNKNEYFLCIGNV